MFLFLLVEAEAAPEFFLQFFLFIKHHPQQGERFLWVFSKNNEMGAHYKKLRDDFKLLTAFWQVEQDPERMTQKISEILLMKEHRFLLIMLPYKNVGFAALGQRNRSDGLRLVA